MHAEEAGFPAHRQDDQANEPRTEVRQKTLDVFSRRHPEWVRHALVSVDPGVEGETTELWFGAAGAVTRTLVDGEIVEECRVVGHSLHLVDLDRMSAIVREGFADTDPRYPLRPILEVAWRVVEDRESEYIRSPLDVDEVTGRLVTQFLPLNEGAIRELIMDSEGLPIRASIGGGGAVVLERR